MPFLMLNRLRTTYFVYNLRGQSSKMSAFIQNLNPITGSNTWTIQDEDYDYHQEVARSAFADMLHDTERNQKYSQALKSAIEKMHSRGRTANVLDIGTGTGLLSMLAVKHGADSVVACEAFAPMSQCALEIIKKNGFAERIRVIPKRSTDLQVGIGGDLESKCNVLVTEVFDTELIGEGALQTFKHAHEVLLEKDCIVVPQSATIFVQVPDCPSVVQWNRVKNIHDDDGKMLVEVPRKIKKCAGSAAVHDLQMQQIRQKNLAAIPVFRFDFSGRTPILFQRTTISTVKAPLSYAVNAVFMWWELQMDTDNRIVLSCAPDWAHPDRKSTSKLPWRDHWMQAIYYLPQEIRVESGQEFYLVSCHDEYSLWFQAKKDLKITETDYVKPICECGLHVNLSRTRIGQINDTKRLKKYLNIIENHVTESSVVLVLSDGFYASLAAAHTATQLYVVESNYLSRNILLDFIKHNKLQNVEVFESAEELLGKSVKPINLVLSEPYFVTSILPWDNLLFFYLLKQVKSVLSDDVQIFPQRATIKALAVTFDNLHKIRTPLDSCEGFVMTDFDKLIEASSQISDDNVEAQPLWEYPGLAVSPVVEICAVDFAKMPEKMVESQEKLDLAERYSSCNGIALWIDWTFGKHTITTGPIIDPDIGSYISWDPHTRQGVSLFQTRNVKSIDYKFSFDVAEGNISFKHS